jgi:hypothetical protein
VSGTFSDGESVVSGADNVTVSEWRERDNYIWAFYGDQNDQGTANTTPLDFDNRKGNPRSSDIKWPGDEMESWDAAEDYFTLVQWNANLNTDAYSDIELLGKGNEENAIIRTNLYVTPDDIYDYPSELGVHSLGGDAIDTYFDDFSIKLRGEAEERTIGFLPPSVVQQE